MPGVSLTYTRIADLRPGMGIVNVVFMVVKQQELGHTIKPTCQWYRLLVADASGNTLLHVLDIRGSWIQPGDVVRLRRGHTYPWSNRMVLSASIETDLHKIGEFTGDPMAADPGPDAFYTFFEYGENGFYYYKSFVHELASNDR